MNATKRKLRERLEKDLNISSRHLEEMLKQTLEITTAQIAEDGWSGRDYQTIEYQFDSLLIAGINGEKSELDSLLIKNIRQRLDNRFLSSSPPNYVQSVYREVQQKFLAKIIGENQFELKPGLGIIRHFQKEWDSKLVYEYRSEDWIKRENIATYYHQYLRNLDPVKWTVAQFKSSFPNRNEDFYESPLQEAFLQFFLKIEASSFTFSKNADAIFLTILRNKITDYLRKYSGPIAIREPSKPTNFDITKAPELAYLEVEEFLKPYEEQYLRYLPTALNEIDEKCERLLSMYFFEQYSMPQIGTKEGVGREAIRQRLVRCNNKLKDILNQLKKNDE